MRFWLGDAAKLKCPEILDPSFQADNEGVGRPAVEVLMSSNTSIDRLVETYCDEPDKTVELLVLSNPSNRAGHCAWWSRNLHASDLTKHKYIREGHLDQVHFQLVVADSSYPIMLSAYLLASSSILCTLTLPLPSALLTLSTTSLSSMTSPMNSRSFSQ